MQIVQINDRGRTELHAADFIRGRARPRVIPRADDEKMFRAHFGCRVCHMIAIKRERSKLVAIVLARDRKNRQRDFLKLLLRRHHRVVISVGRRMFQNALKIY